MKKNFKHLKQKFITYLLISVLVMSIFNPIIANEIYAEEIDTTTPGTAIPEENIEVEVDGIIQDPTVQSDETEEQSSETEEQSDGSDESSSETTKEKDMEKDVIVEDGDLLKYEAQKLTRSIAQPDSWFEHNSKFDGYVVTKGIDISEWQGNIDFNKVKASGVEFVIIRVGGRGYVSGGLFYDSMYETYISQAKAAGLEIGFYVYSNAITTAEARAEADMLITAANKYGSDLPLVMDYEFSYQGAGEDRLKDANLSKQAMTNICNAFTDRVISEGYESMIYGNYDMLTNYLYGEQIIDGGAEVWLAQYNKTATYTGEYSYWQYTSAGSVSGINGHVDSIFKYNTPTPSKVIGGRVYNTDQQNGSFWLTWNAGSNVDGYIIYRSHNSSTGFEKIATVPGKTTYADYGTVDGKVNYYYIVGYNYFNGKYYYGTPSSVFKSPTMNLATANTPSKVGGLKIAATTKEGFDLTWSQSYYADGYVIYRADSTSNKYQKIATVPNNTNYTDTDVEHGKSYKYYVTAYNADNGKYYYAPNSSVITSKVFSIEPDPTSGIRVYSTTSKSFWLTWHKVANADGYVIYRSENKNSGYSKIATVAGKTTFADYAVDHNKNYYYKIMTYSKADNNKYYYGNYSPIYLSPKFNAVPGVVTGIRYYNSGSTERAALTWNSVSNADGYILYKSTDEGKSYSKIATVPKKITYYDYDVEEGQNYYYYIQTYNSANGKYYYANKSTTYKYTH